MTDNLESPWTGKQGKKGKGMKIKAVHAADTNFLQKATSMFLYRPAGSMEPHLDWM